MLYINYHNIILNKLKGWFNILGNLFAQFLAEFDYKYEPVTNYLQNLPLYVQAMSLWWQ